MATQILIRKFLECLLLSEHTCRMKEGRKEKHWLLLHKLLFQGTHVPLYFLVFYLILELGLPHLLIMLQRSKSVVSVKVTVSVVSTLRTTIILLLPLSSFHFQGSSRSV